MASRAGDSRSSAPSRQSVPDGLEDRPVEGKVREEGDAHHAAGGQDAPGPIRRQPDADVKRDLLLLHPPPHVLVVHGEHGPDVGDPNARPPKGAHGIDRGAPRRHLVLDDDHRVARTQPLEVVRGGDGGMGLFELDEAGPLGPDEHRQDQRAVDELGERERGDRSAHREPEHVVDRTGIDGGGQGPHHAGESLRVERPVAPVQRMMQDAPTLRGGDERDFAQEVHRPGRVYAHAPRAIGHIKGMPRCPGGCGKRQAGGT